MIQKMMDFLKKWFGKRCVEQVKDTTLEMSVKKESKNRKLTLLDDLEEYLFSILIERTITKILKQSQLEKALNLLDKKHLMIVSILKVFIYILSIK